MYSIRGGGEWEGGGRGREVGEGGKREREREREKEEKKSYLGKIERETGSDKETRYRAREREGGTF